MDATSAVYIPLSTKKAWRPSLFHRAHQSIVKSPIATAVVLISMMLLSFVAGGAFVYVSVYSSHYHEDLGQAHQVGIVNASCSGECEETQQQNLTQCLHIIEVINSTVSHVGKSKAHLLQLKSDIQNKIATLHLKNPSLIPHSRWRPPMDTWNT